MKYLELFLIYLRLGLTSFGGPVAHLSYFHDEFVKRKKWISDHTYTELVALCQFLPGPVSSQVGIAIGFSRAGLGGAVLAWLGFTLPSAIILVLFALGLTHINLEEHQHWIHGLKVVAVAVVAQAVLAMGKKSCPDKIRIIIAIFASVSVLIINSPLIQILVLIIAGIVGALFLKTSSDLPSDPIPDGYRRIGAIFLLLFILLLVLLPILRSLYPIQSLKLFDSFFRAGALVFGGGHVVLPLLQVEVVPTGWVSNDLFMAGYGIANAIPGPLFAFTAYLGAISSFYPNRWLGATICLVAAFLPSFLLVIGVLPFWEKLRTLTRIRQAILGINAAVVGILLAALYNPVWTNAIFTFKDFVLGAIGFLFLEFLKLPSWAIVMLAVIFSFIYNFFK